MNPATTGYRWLILVFLAASLAGCGLWPKITGKEEQAKMAARQLDSTRHICQRYADEYAGKVIETLNPVKKDYRDPESVNRLIYWEITQLNSAYTIATGPSPFLCHLDFVVLATLSRMVVEDTLSVTDPDLKDIILPVYLDLEQQAWINSEKLLTREQMEEMRGLITAWRSKNPQVKLVGFVNFSKFADAAGWPTEAKSAPGSLFGRIGLDPLAGLDPAVKQIEQTRLLAERVIFYMQRVPYLLDLQTERVISQTTTASQVERANASLERASLAMTEYATIGASLPDAIASEREALIRQLSGELLRQETELRGVLSDLQITLTTGTGTAAAVDSAIESLDRLVARFPRKAPESGSAAGRSFDITEYTAAAAEFTGTARQLIELLEALGNKGEPMAAAVADGVEAGRDLVDYLFWRILLLGLLLIAGALAAALAFRALTSRRGSPA